MDVIDFVNEIPINNIIVADSFVMADKIINDEKYKKIICSISGGSDSDIMLDLITKVDKYHKVQYVYFDTGIEYDATKRHLKYLEDKYGITIKTLRAKKKSIPLSCKEYGEPFISKLVSENIERLQRHGFTFEDKSFEELSAEYSGCRSAIEWWCNERKHLDAHDYSMFDISYNKWLKEFLIENPPKFKISSKCCNYAKKKVSHQIIRETKCDVMITGMRKSEGGIRAARYSSCFGFSTRYKTYMYRPIFWYTAQDKIQYENLFNVIHSDCYTKYGFERTGCACCPYSKEYLHELNVTRMYEPLLYKAVTNIFSNSYAYTREFNAFRRKMKNKEKGRVQLF